MPGRSINHGRWNDGRIVASNGYVKIRVGLGHPLADSRGYAYEHLVVWRAAGRKMPRRHELLHHKNENKEDNRIRNLGKKTRARHSREHACGRKRNRLGQFFV